MVEEIGNIILIVAFGLLLGTILSIFMILAPPSKPEIKEKGESFRHYINRVVKEKATEALPTYQRKSVTILGGVYFIVIITIIIVVVFTALEMKWIAFIISLFTAFLVTRYIYIRVKFGKGALKELFFEP